VSNTDNKYDSDWDSQWNNLTNGDLKAMSHLDMQALKFGYEFDGVLKDELLSPPVFTVILFDSSRSEILFKSHTLQAAVKLAIDQMTFLSVGVEL
jgi:hypothetical protein